MAWDLWSSSWDQVFYDGDYPEAERFEWHRDYFGGDVIEEDALNEECCVQVLRTLNTKADAEIEELEKDLLSLQNELAWAQDENWREICSSALTERINWLDVAVSKLKSGCADDTETQLQLHSKPAETLQEIVKALQRGHCQETDVQHLDANILNPIVNVTEHALDNGSGNIDSNGTMGEEGKEHYETSESSRSSELLLELHEKVSDDLEKTEHLDANSPNPIVNVIEHALDNDSGNIDSNGTVGEERKEHYETSESSRSSELLLELHEKVSDDLEKTEHLDANIPNPIVNVIEHALDNDSGNIDSNGTVGEERKEHYETLESSRSSELLLELHEKISDDDKKTEELLAISLVRSPDLGALSCVPDHFDGMASSDTLDDEVIGNEDIRRSQPIAIGTGQIMNPFPFKGLGIIPSEAKEEYTTVKKNVCSDGYEFAFGIKGRTMYIRSRVGTVQQRESENSDLDEKICDFATKTARRARRKESKVAPDEGLESMNPLQVVYPQKSCFADTELSAFKGTNGNNSLQVVNFEKATLINDENSALISLPRMQTKNTRCTGLHLICEENSQVQDLEFEIATNLSNSNMSSPSNVKARRKRKPKSEAYSAKEPPDSPVDVIPITTENVSTKRQRKSKTHMPGTVLNESMNWKITKRAMQPGQHETEGHGAKSEACSAKEPPDSPMDVIPITTENVPTTRQRKSKTCMPGTILNESMNRKVTKRGMQPGQHETEGHDAMVLYDSQSKTRMPGHGAKSEACSAKEPPDSPMDVIPITTENVPTTRQRKSKTCMPGTILNESMNRKVTKRGMQPGQHETEGHDAMVLYDSQSKTRMPGTILNESMNRKITNRAMQPGKHETEGHDAMVLYDSQFCELQKKGASQLPITSIVPNSLDITISDRVLMDGKYSLADSLKKMKLVELRALGKLHKISRYYKLAKGPLVEQLVDYLSNC